MNKYIYLAAAALMLAACNNDNEPATPDNGPVAAQINAAIEQSTLTRATGTTWGTGDRIGITATSQTGTQYTNIAYAYNGTSFTAEGTGIYFQDTDEVTFNAYYPFTGMAGTSAGTVSVSTAATNQTAANQPTIDYLFASGATASKENPVVNFTGDAAFRHRMSQITLTFKEGDDISFANRLLESYSLKRLYLDGTFDTATGKAEADATGARKDLDLSLPVVAAGTTSVVSSVILLPQEVANGTISLVVVVDGQYYYATLTIPNSGKALEPGCNYIWPVTVSKTGLTVGQAQIEDWKDVTGSDTFATM